MPKPKTKIKIANCKLLKSSGFTLIELVISLAVMAILAGTVLQIARFSDTQTSLTLASDEFRAALRTAQSSALSIPNPLDRHVCGFGVYVGPAGKQYELFYTYVSDADFASDPETCRGDATYRTYTAPNKVMVSENTLSDELVFQNRNDESIFFIVPYGEIYDNNGDRFELGDPDVDFILENTNISATKDVTVSATGKIE